MDEQLIKRVMPHSTDAEKSVIGAMLIDSEAVLTVSEILVPDDFYGKQYGILFDAMVSLYMEGKPIDLVMLENKLKEMNVAPELSSIDVAKDIFNQVFTSANVKHYANIVKEKSILRRIIKTNEEIANRCYLQKDTLDDILNLTEKKIFNIMQTQGGGDYVPVKQIVINVLENIEKATKTKGNVTGIPTGFRDLDYQTSGMQPSDLVLIAARPSMGKTAFVLNLAEHMAFKKKVTVAIFSLEMSKEQLINRILSIESRVSSQSLRTGNLEDDDWDKVIEAAQYISNSKLIVDDTPSISIQELRSKCRKYKLEHNLGIIIIDYLQLMSAGDNSSDSRQQQISDISRSLKALARELNVPVIALSQLSRAVEQRPDHRPMLSDLRESGAIEQDADVVMFLYRDYYYDKQTENPDVAEVIIAKQRNGPVGTVYLKWIAELTKFGNLEKRNDDH
ncbi:MAG: replicative DNA helicase [Lachnospiraceae bacterium]|nr:replicative DNA helicase [Lachnospiraceae bacterium]